MCSKGSNEQFAKKSCHSLLNLVTMPRFAFLALLALTVVQCYGALQVQMPATAELQHPEQDLQSQIKDLQNNVSDIWTYIYELRNAVSGHLNHLRQHQVELETSMHKMEHLHEGELKSSDLHHQGDEHHSHSGEHHSHSDEQHSHGGDHSHSGEHHSHSGEQHSHSDEHHSHGDEHGHHSHSYSHSHSSHDRSGHSHGDDHLHHGHKDSHETEDLSQQTQQVAGPPPVAEPVVTATNRQEHYHHHHQSFRTSQSGDADSLNLMNENFHSRHYHHHHNSDSRRRNKTVEIPKYTDYGLYDLVSCDVTPNRAIPEDQQQNVVGTITAWQKKTGGQLNIHVSLRGFNMGDHHGHHQSVQREEDNETPQAVGHKHGFHVHTFGDLSNGCQSTGPHYNPKGVKHGGPNALERHIGDLGSIECDDHGVTDIAFSDDIASLSGPYSIIGKSFVIHALQDDLGLGGNEESSKTGNAGTRIACCVIRRVEKIPLRQLKAIKLASQYQNR